MNDHGRAIREQFAAIRHSDGTLPAFTSVGCYTITYLTDDGAVFCAKCANGENGSEACFDDDSRSGWRVVAYDVFYEGPPEYCAHCNAVIESSYGDPDEDR